MPLIRIEVENINPRCYKNRVQKYLKLIQTNYVCELNYKLLGEPDPLLRPPTFS